MRFMCDEDAEACGTGFGGERGAGEEGTGVGKRL